MDKKEMRRYIRKQKALLSLEERTRESELVCRSVMATAQWQKAATVLLYWALKDETDVGLLIDDLHGRGGTVLLPTCVGDDLVLREYEGRQKMVTGAFDIAEPTGRIFEEAEYGKIDLAIVPGMAFDRQGGRMGRGRGYYDRLLKKLPHCYKMGVCWSVQMMERVEMNDEDVRMESVVSPNCPEGHEKEGNT